MERMIVIVIVTAIRTATAIGQRADLEIICQVVEAAPIGQVNKCCPAQCTQRVDVLCCGLTSQTQNYPPTQFDRFLSEPSLSLTNINPSFHNTTIHTHPHPLRHPHTIHERLGDSDRDKNKDRYPATEDNIANRFQPTDGKNEYDTRAPGKQGNQNGNHGMYTVLVVISQQNARHQHIQKNLTTCTTLYPVLGRP